MTPSSEAPALVPVMNAIPSAPFKTLWLSFHTPTTWEPYQRIAQENCKQLAVLRGWFFHTEFWDGTAACHDFSLLQEMVTGKYPSTSIILYLPFYLSIYSNLSVPISTCQSIDACRLGRCLHHGIHFSACEHVLLGDLGWALDCRYWYNVIHMSN